MGLYENNLNALKKHNEKLYNQINEDSFEWDEKEVLIEEAKNGEKILAFLKQGNKIYLSSKYNPLNEAKKIMEDKCDIPNVSAIYIFGMSNCDCIREFLEQTEESMCIVYEPKKSIFMAALNSIDIKDILEDSRVRFVIGEINKDTFLNYLSQTVLPNNIKTNKYFALPIYEKVFEEEYHDFLEMLQEKYYDLEITINTICVDGKAMCKNEIDNMKFLPGCRSAVELYDSAPEDIPAIIVSAGPSLEKNVDLLKEAKGKALIISVDTAIPKVVSRGIIPDMIITVDCEKSLKHFMVDGIADMPFLVDMDSNAAVLDYVKSKDYIFYSSNSVIWDKLFKKADSEIRAVGAGGSVALEALANAVLFGFKKIILIGQDLAYTNNKQYADENEIVKEEINVGTRYVKDIYGNDVLTRNDYFSFIRDIERIAYNNKDIEIIDATEGGAFKKHTTIMTLREAIDTYCTKEFDVKAFLSKPKRLFVGEDKKIITDAILDMKKNLSELKEKMLKGIKMSLEGKKLLETRNFKVDRLKKINKYIKEVDDAYSNLEERSYIVAYSAISNYEFMSDFYVEKENHIEESIRIYDKSAKLYKGLSESISDIVKMLDECYEDMTKE
ncbi:MAG: motility associated factor glycosyltransferase family protein [Lachnospiraceae bacterium]|nr:motility associated factor glycosyltransferase family protein [Lachnospiraceae bacterium]